MPSPLRIFLIEDNPIVRQALVEIIEDLLNAQVVGWADAEVPAIAWLEAHLGDWDTAVVDMSLSSGNGLGVLRNSPRRSATQHMVVLSNYATPEIRRECLAAGADAVFDKSQEIDEFTQYVADIGNTATRIVTSAGAL